MDSARFQMLRTQVEARRAQRKLLQEQPVSPDHIQAVGNVSMLIQQIQAERNTNENK